MSHHFWPVGQAVKTPPFHGGIPGSIPGRVTTYGRLAQLGERLPYKQDVGSSILSSSTICGNSSAVEHRLAKAGVASSNLVSRSNFIWRHSQAVGPRSAKPLFPSSILGAASTNRYPCRGGGTGRRNGLKIRRLETTVPVRFRSSAPIKTNFRLVFFLIYN